MFLSLCTKNNCSMIHRTVGTEHCMSNTEQHWEPIRSNRRDTQCDKHFPNKNVPTNTKCSLWESANTPYKELCIPHKCVWPSRALCPKDNRLPEHIDCLPHRGTLRWAQCLCTLSNCLQRHRTTDTLDDTANTFWHFPQIHRNWRGTQCDTRCSENKFPIHMMCSCSPTLNMTSRALCTECRCAWGLTGNLLRGNLCLQHIS